MSTVPPINPAVLPPDVRAAGKKGEQLYADALGFENMLLQQLTQQMFGTSGAGGPDGLAGLGTDGSGGSSSDSLMSGDATSSAFTSMLPQAMADALTSAGGVGLADRLYRSFAAQYGVPTTSAPGTTGTVKAPGASA